MEVNQRSRILTGLDTTYHSYEILHFYYC